MATGETLARYFPRDQEPPATNYAPPGLRNGHPTLQFDDTTGWKFITTDVMPSNYSNATGVTVIINASAVATSGTMGWLVAFELMTGLDLDGDNFASDQTVTASAVPGTSGVMLQLSVAIAKGANMASVVAGSPFRIRITRDVANDTAVGNVEIETVEIRET